LFQTKSSFKKCVLPALKATETQFFQHNGKVKSSHTVVAWGPRVATNRLVAEMMGLLKQEQQNTAPASFLAIPRLNRSSPTCRGDTGLAFMQHPRMDDQKTPAERIIYWIAWFVCILGLVMFVLKYVRLER
jgi:hypothetical protein